MVEQSGGTDVLCRQESQNTNGSVAQTVTAKLMAKIKTAFDEIFESFALEYVSVIREVTDVFASWVSKKQAILENITTIQGKLQNPYISTSERENYTSKLNMLNKEFFEVTINLLEKDLSREAQQISQRCIQISHALIDQYNAFCRQIVSLIPETNQNPQLLLSRVSLTTEHAQRLSNQLIAFSGISSPAFNDALTWQRTARNMLPKARKIIEDAGLTQVGKGVFFGILTLFVTPLALLGGVHAYKEYKDGQEFLKQFDETFLRYMESLNTWIVALFEEVQLRIGSLVEEKSIAILTQLELLVKEISNVDHLTLSSLEEFIVEAISKAKKQIQTAETQTEARLKELGLSQYTQSEATKNLHSDNTHVNSSLEVRSEAENRSQVVRCNECGIPCLVCWFESSDGSHRLCSECAQGSVNGSLHLRSPNSI